MDAGFCSSCAGRLDSEWKLCPSCGHPNPGFQAPKKDEPPLPVVTKQKGFFESIGLGGTLAIIIVGLVLVGIIAGAIRGQKTVVANVNSFSPTAQPMDNSSQTSAQWLASLPEGFRHDPNFGLDVAFRPVPNSQDRPCVYCSSTHGNSYWDVQFLSKNACSLLYMNAAIYDSNNQFEKYWYQKFYNTSASPTIYNGEIVTADPSSHYTIQTLSCTP